MRFELPFAMLGLASFVSAGWKIQWAPAQRCSAAQLVEFSAPEKYKCYELPPGIQSVQIEVDGDDAVTLWSDNCDPNGYPDDRVDGTADGHMECLASPGYKYVMAGTLQW